MLDRETRADPPDRPRAADRVAGHTAPPESRASFPQSKDQASSAGIRARKARTDTNRCRTNTRSPILEMQAPRSPAGSTIPDGSRPSQRHRPEQTVTREKTRNERYGMKRPSDAGEITARQARRRNGGKIFSP